MHINLRQADDGYSGTELIHLQQCELCQNDLKILELLQDSTKTLPLIVPEEMNWQVIQQRLIVKDTLKEKKQSKITKLFFYKQIMAVAASTFFIAVGWLVWNNYQLQTQLEQTLVLNQQLEIQLQLEYGSSLTFQQVHLLTELEQIDIALSKAVSVKGKVSLLNLRYEKLVKINQKKEVSNEISI